MHLNFHLKPETFFFLGIVDFFFSELAPDTQIYLPVLVRKAKGEYINFMKLS